MCIRDRVIVTHQMEVVKEVCERVALIDGGIVKAEGRAEDLFLKPGASLKKFLGEEDETKMCIRDSLSSGIYTYGNRCNRLCISNRKGSK